jgi:multiple sugar transport system permease protein
MAAAPGAVGVPGVRAGEQAGGKVKTSSGPSHRGRKIALWLAVIATLVFCLFPFYWLINTSLKTGAELNSAAAFPSDPSLSNYSDVLSDDAFLQALRNSVIVSGAVTLLSVLFGSFAAYALARLDFPRKFLLLAVVLSISTFPPIAIAAPVFQLWSDIGLYNTRLGLILPTLTFALPLAIYILSSFFREIPKDLSEAALVDGATPFQVFRKVILPLAAPGVATAALLTFIFAWNEYLFAITLTSDPSVRTVPAAIGFFTGEAQFEVPLGRVSAASVIVTVPLVLLVLIFQRRIVAGLTSGAVKG